MAHPADTSITANLVCSATVDIAATPIASTNAVANAPSNLRSSLSRRNSPCGMRSTFTCIANSTSDVTIAVAPISALPVFKRRLCTLWTASSVANRVSRSVWRVGNRYALAAMKSTTVAARMILPNRL